MSWLGSVTVHVEGREVVQVARTSYRSLDGPRPLLDVHIGKAATLCGDPEAVVETLSLALASCQDELDRQPEAVA